MSVKKTYSEKLKHPKWQKKRLEILERDNFTCQSCKAEDKTLHIHHFQYNNCEPWEYDNTDLITLCEKCHEHEEFLKNFTGCGFDYVATLGFLRNDLSKIIQSISIKCENLNDLERRKYFDNIKNLIINCNG